MNDEDKKYHLSDFRNLLNKCPGDVDICDVLSCLDFYDMHFGDGCIEDVVDKLIESGIVRKALLYSHRFEEHDFYE